MHVAIAVGTFLLAGWTLDAPAEDEVAVPEAAQPAAAAPVATYPMGTSRSRGGGAARGGATGSLPMLGRSAKSQAFGAPRQGASPLMPLLPTEAAPQDAAGLPGQLMAPTSSGPLMATGGAGASSSNFIRRPAPIAPTAMQPRSAQAFSAAARLSSSGAGQQNVRPPAIHGASIMAPAVPDKAFSSWRQSSGVSPYMLLFNRSGQGIDNYTNLVRPQIEQRFLNQQFGRDIYGLERNTHVQQNALQQLNQQNRGLQGVATPQFYMNYQNFYQGQGFGQ